MSGIKPNPINKKCASCKKIKPVACFCKNRSRYDGYANKCRSCKKLLDYNYRANNIEKIKAREKLRPPKPYESKMTQEYKDKVEKWATIREEKEAYKQYLTSIKEFSLKPCSSCLEVKEIDLFPTRKVSEDGHSGVCMDCTKTRINKNRHENIEKYRELDRKYKSSEKYKNYRKEYIKKNRDKINKRKRDRLKNDPGYQFKKNISNRILSAMKREYKKAYSSEVLLGCTIYEARNHIEKQFVDGMNWDNHGCNKNQWSIDHIIPCSSFDLTDSDQQLICFNYKNLQPLWHIDNLKKSNKIT